MNGYGTRGRRAAVAAVLVSAAAGTGVLAAGGPAAAARDSEAAADRAAVQDVRDATEQYRDVDRALADGFVATTVCTDSPAGGMGLHYVNPQRLGQPLDPAKPSVLLYRRVGSHLQLLAAEWFSPDPDQDLATDSGRPTLFGHPFDGPMAGHEPGMPIHFDLHVWAWHSNPSGDFSPWNPTISC